MSIRATDNLSLGIPKVVYLVGWQYNGHDDKYPAFFDANPLLKRDCDQTALESLRWLMREARKYHTTVSLHINMTDAYDDSPLWNEYVEHDLISKNADGSLKVIGEYNNRKAYQINYQREWEKEFGKCDYYLVDSFNEMDIPFPEKGNPARYEMAASYGEKVYSSIKRANKDAVWVMQGWMFGYQRHI